ncbi:MAG TPA: SGNH/GDSL hydrolase family protein [Myxococcota bacterium]|nr:SGNH/GDSL hydrolase family protein [Myxococcota bacterium]
MRWIALLLSVLGALVGGEALARRVVDDVYLERQIGSGGLLVPYEPGLSADLLQPEFRVRYDINRFGYRDRLDRSEARTPGVPRVALLGDSFAAGWGVEFADTFASRFERATGIEVIDSAKNGGCPLWYVPQARWLRERFSPDWLLVQLFDNDPDDDRQFMDRFELAYGDRVGELPRAIGPLDTLGRWLRHAWDATVIQHRFRQLQRRLSGKRLARTPYVKPGAKPDAPILTRAQAIARYAIDLSPNRPWDGPFSFHDPGQREEWRERIAWNAQLLDQLIEEAARADVPVAVLYIPAYPVFLRAREPNPAAAAVREVAERRGALWLDATDWFATAPTPAELYYAFDSHLDPAGHAAIAAALARELAPRVRVAY